MCDMHYRRTKKFGDPHIRGGRVIPSPEDRFWEKVDATGDCWAWSGAHDRDGYSVFSIDNRSVKVHRFAYELLIAPIPPGLTIDHLCRNTGCVNPSHMEPVSMAENLRRAHRHRSTSARAESSSFAKLNPDLVREIRRSVAAGEMQKTVASRIGISRANVSLIVTRKTWAHVD